MISKLKALKSQFYLKKSEKRFINFAKRKWTLSKANGSAELLIETQHHDPYLFRSAFQSHYLANVFHLQIRTVNPVVGTTSVFLHKFLYRFTAIYKLYASFGAKPGLNYYSCSLCEKRQSKKLAKEIFSKIKNKEDILNIKISGITVGDLIYDSYLRRNSLSTVDLKDNRLYQVIYYAHIVFNSAKRYLDTHKVKIMMMSHAVYIQHGILCRLAIQYNIDVYLFPANGGKVIHKLSKNHYLQTIDHKLYKEQFHSVVEKKEALEKAKKELCKRLNGGIDSGTAYMQNTAYSDISSNEEHIKSDNKSIVIVFLHCFFDSPHIYANALFPDFHEWLDFTLRTLSQENYDVYVKPHPNGLPSNRAIIKKFEEKYKKIKFLETSISNKYIASLNVAAAVTVYGTIGHEFPYQGIPVVAAGDNPHIEYSFCNTAKTIEEYEYLLRNVKNLSRTLNKEEIEQFFYMHYLHPGDGRVEVNDDWYKFIKKIRRSPDEPDLLNQLIDSAENGDFDNIARYFELALKQVGSFN